jgi:hypothetical protein
MTIVGDPAAAAGPLLVTSKSESEKRETARRLMNADRKTRGIDKRFSTDRCLSKGARKNPVIMYRLLSRLLE